ncbi:MAG: EAL domain-containing protein [Gammaproteobacteria bacterium]|nr:EAL domain-containing protein [Gammaproteobacteria bacterium]
MKASTSWLGTSYRTNVPYRHGAAAENVETPVSTILVVDDDHRMRQSVKELLSAYGYQSMTADGGAEALRILGEHAIDLMLLDLNMPGVDGYQVMQQVSEKHPDTDIVVISGETTFESATEALRCGAQDFLRKPYAPDRLIQILNGLLQKQQIEQNIRDVKLRLEASEQRYRFIVNNSPDIIYMLDGEGCFAFVNDRVFELLGYKPDEIMSRHYSELVHKEDLEKARYAFDERRTGRRASHNIELRLLCKDSSLPYRYFESRSITIELNAMGMYGDKAEEKNRQKGFIGTYGVARDISERKRAEEVINFQLYHDLLTRLPNRALFRDRLNHAISQARRNDSQLAVMYLDMDRFKVINDSLGHLAGDQLLQTVASRLSTCLRDSDTLARVGGDEFNLLVPDISGREDVVRIATKIFEKLKLPVDLEGCEIFISFSVGIALFPQDGATMEALVKNADMAMYHIKSHGKNGYEFFSDNIKGLYQQQLSMENGIRRALEEDQFELFFQPQVEVNSGRICGMEALIRWHHPERGLILPDDFIPLSEDSQLIVGIGSWVLEAACRELRKWSEAGAVDVVMAINISAVQLEQQGFAQSILETLQRHGLSGNRLELEITENILMRDMDRAVLELRKLAGRGVRVAVDDFGVGYSSLGYLKSLPLNTLKIDRLFISEIQSSQGNNSIITAIIAMARELNLDIIAEGVENPVQMEYLKALKCPKAQGFLLGYPISASDAMLRLQQVVP